MDPRSERKVPIGPPRQIECLGLGVGLRVQGIWSYRYRYSGRLFMTTWVLDFLAAEKGAKCQRLV